MKKISKIPKKMSSDKDHTKDIMGNTEKTEKVMHEAAATANATKVEKTEQIVQRVKHPDLTLLCLFILIVAKKATQ